jgi:hypothetical protein
LAYSRAHIASVRATETQIQQAAQQLVAEDSSNLGSIQQAGNQALANGRNEATIVAYMNRASPFKGYDAVQREYSRLEKFAGMMTPTGIAPQTQLVSTWSRLNSGFASESRWRRSLIAES